MVRVCRFLAEEERFGGGRYRSVRELDEALEGQADVDEAQGEEVDTRATPSTAEAEGGVPAISTLGMEMVI